MILKKIMAALKGGRFMAEHGQYWKGMTLLSGFDQVKTYELFSALPLRQARESGGLSIVPQSAWATMDKSEKSMFVGHYPIFVNDGRNRVNKYHVKRVLNGYQYLCELRSQDGRSASMLQGKHQTLLTHLFDNLPHEFETKSEVPFSSEWFLELYNAMEEGQVKDTFQDLARGCGLHAVVKERALMEPHTDWSWLEYDLKGLSQAYLTLAIEPEYLKDLALSSHQTLIIPEMLSEWERAVVSDMVCTTIDMIQSALYEGESMHHENVTRENYPVFIHLNRYDAFNELGVAAHKAKYSHMAMFMVAPDLDFLRKNYHSQTLFAAGFKLFDTDFCKKKGAFGFKENGLYPGEMETVYLN